MMTKGISPYLLDEPPTSTGKVLLARAFAYWCALHHGLDPNEVAQALAGHVDAEPVVRSQVGMAARLIGELIAAGNVRTFARPFGGGSPEKLAATAWELDDFRQRMACSAINPKAPFETDTEPTHWIFVDLEDFNRIVECSCADVMATRKPPPAAARQTVAVSPAGPAEDRHVRMPELKRRTGMSRSTIYRRIEEGRFPRQIPMVGNISSWWESEIAEWLANPR